MCKIKEKVGDKVNNVTGIWLKGRHLDKIAIYSRPEKIVCILI